jgi:hypothetical protein
MEAKIFTTEGTGDTEESHCGLRVRLRPRW